MRLLTINSREWKCLAPLLPPTGGRGRPRLDDRLVLAGLLYSVACQCSLRSLPPIWQLAFLAKPPGALASHRAVAPAVAGRRADDCADEGQLLGRDPRRFARLSELIRILGPRHHAEKASPHATPRPPCRRSAPVKIPRILHCAFA